MMKKKILIISPTPTHPANAGNRIRIFNMASFLISRGHEVHFLYSRQENADESAMKKFWGDYFHAVDYKKPGLTKIEKLKRRIMLFLRSDYKYYSEVDEHYNLLLDDKIRELIASIRFDIVLVEYIFLSKAFLNFNRQVVKVIDTHDVMTDRHKLFLKEGKKPVWYSVPYRQEKKGIIRADVVIAIQENEKAHFSRMTRKPVVNVGHIVKIRKAISKEPRKKLLFVGSNNPSNLYGINDFINDYWPGIREAYPGIELIIAGNICGQLKQLPGGVILLGEIDDLSEAYNQADIVINPLTIGTGLKIKMIEALGYSKVVLSTPVGAEGLEEGAGKGYLLYKDTHEFLEKLDLIFSNHLRYNEICRGATEIARTWNRKNGQGLLDTFSDNESFGNFMDFSDIFILKDQLQAERLNIALQKSPEIQKFVIISIPRSGSNLLVGLLSSHKDIICYPELYHPDAIYDGRARKKTGRPEYPIGKRNEDPIKFLEYIYSLKFDKDPKVIGFKIFPDHNDSLMELVIQDPNIKKVLLIRENFLLNFISLKVAEESKVFYIEAGGEIASKDEIKISIDFDEFIRFETRFKYFYSKLKQLLIQNNQPFHEVHYEDLLKPDRQIELLKFLAVTPGDDLLKICSSKQNHLPIEQKVINFREIREHLIQSGLEVYLNKEEI